MLAVLNSTLTHSLERFGNIFLIKCLCLPSARWRGLIRLVAALTEVHELSVHHRLDHAAVSRSLLLPLVVEATRYCLLVSSTPFKIHRKRASMFGRRYLRLKHPPVSLLILLIQLHFYRRRQIVHVRVKLLQELCFVLRTPAHSLLHELHFLESCFRLERLLLAIRISVSRRTVLVLGLLLRFLSGMLSSDYELQKVIRLQSGSYGGIGPALHASGGSVIVDVILYVLVILFLVGFTHLLIIALTRTDILRLAVHVITHLRWILYLQ